MAILWSPYPLFKIDLYHIDLGVLLYHLLISHICSGPILGAFCPFGLFFNAAATSFQLLRLYSVCKLSGRAGVHSLLFSFFFFLSYFSGFFACLNFHINIRIPCLVPGGKQNPLVSYWNYIKYIL